MDEGVAFCQKCGAPAGTAAQAQGAPVGGAPMMAQSDAEQNKLMGILAYLGFLCLVPLFAAKDSKFARFHANQGLILFIAEAAYGIVVAILSGILWSLVWSNWGLYGIVSAITGVLGILWVVFGVLAIIGITNAAAGKEKPLPIIGKITLLK